MVPRYKLTNKNAPAMVGAFGTHHRESTWRCNNSCGQTLIQTCADYTREVAPYAMDNITDQD
jgi:hypothetical protein